MAPSHKVKAAFKAMREIGILEDKTKPALKRLLKLYDKNWDLIEAENYRVLADSIFEFEDEDKNKNTETAENEKKKLQENVDQGPVCDEADQTQEEPERPLKRLRLKHQGQAASSHGQNSANSASFLLKTPKPEPGEPEAFSGQQASLLTDSSQTLVRNKGKQPLLPESGQGNKRPAPERSSKPLQIREPKAVPAATPVQKQPNGSTLIKPKDEPIDDMLSIEPLAVVLPDQVPQESTPVSQTKNVRKRQEPPSNSGNPVCGKDGQGSGDSKSVDGINKGPGTLDPSSGKDHIVEVGGSNRTPANIEIAASGKVKLSLSCDPDLEGKCLDSEDIQAVLKKVNDDCLHKYKIMDTKFSILRVMEDFCEHVGKGVVADGVHPEKSNHQDAGVIDSNGICGLQPNGSNIADASDNVAAADDGSQGTETDASISTTAFKFAPETVQSDKHTADNHCAERGSCVAGLNNKSLMVVQQQQLNPVNLHKIFDTSDITRGKEAMKVSLEESNCDSPPMFHYIPQNIISHDADLIFSLAQIGDQDCCLSCFGDCLALSASCKCARRNGGESPYTSDGLIREEFLDKCVSMVQKPQKDNLVYCKECPLERLKNEDMLDPCKGHLKRSFIKECWTKCGCNKVCGNRVVQNGISRNLQVFCTPEGKGWGLRALEDLPKGAFICEFIGEILTITELHKRSLKRSNDKHSYSVLLDTEWGSKTLKEAEFLCLDATVYGNIARFINHRCSDANLIEIPVEVETPSHHYYHVALFTTRKVDAFEELTWDYGVDFDDGENHIKAFRCLCGSNFCRNMKRSSRSRSAILQ